MNTYLDERFPTLAAVCEVVDGEAARIEALKEARRSNNAKLYAEAQERHAKQQAERERRVRAAIENDAVPVEQFSPQTAAKISDVRRLKVRQRVLELALDASKYLQNKDANTSNLASVLTSLTVLAPSDELAEELHSRVRQQWWQPRMDEHCAELRKVLIAAGWPRTDPTAGSSTVREALKQCLGFELEGARNMQTFDVLAAPLAERIAFNFRPGQDTAREDRPEWLFSYILKLVEPHMAWLAGEVQPMVDMPAERLFRALSPAIVKSLQTTYVLDAHFVEELLKFKTAVQTRLLVARETVDECIVAAVLDGSTLIAYLHSERTERRHALDSILKADSGAHVIDFDADVPCAKPPFSAESAWQLIAQTAPLLPLDAKLVALEIGVPLVERVFAYWEGSLEAFNRSHSSLARAVGGHDAERTAVLPEMPDHEYLAHIIGAAAYLEINLETISAQLEIIESAWPIDAQVTKFAALRSLAAQKMANTLGLEAQKHLRPYLQVEWRDPEDHGHRLKTAIDAVSPRLAYVERLCTSSRADRARIFVGLATSVAETIWRVVINANVFTPASAGALREDLEELWARWALPPIAAHKRNIAATNVLQTGTDCDGITGSEADALLRRRKT